MTRKSLVHLVTLAVVTVALAAPAFAQWGPEQERNCAAGTLTLAAQGGSGIDDSSKLQQFETFPTGVFVPCAAFGWQGSQYFLDARGTKLGLDDQFASVVAGKKGGFKLSLSWDLNPNFQSNTARTPYTEVSPGVFRVPDGMQLGLQNVYVPWIAPTGSNPIGTGSAPANPTVPGFFAAEDWVSNSFPVDLRYVRKTGRAGLSYPVGQSLKVNVSFMREIRDGNKNTSFYGGPVYEVATPIDYRTDTFRAEAEFARGRFFASAAADFSTFKNDVPFVTIDNPQRLELANPTNGRNVINDSDSFRLWMYPDNKAYQADFNGGVTLPRRHKITASVSTGNMSMDTALLALSTNPNLATSATAPNAAFSVVPPYSSIEAQYDTFMGQLKLTGDPIPLLGYSLSYRKFELTDGTEHYAFPSTVRGDVGPSVPAEPYVREHEGWGIETLRAEAHVTPARGLRLSASYGQDKRAYDIREYADVTDDVITLAADYSYRWATLHAVWTTLDRKPGGVNEEAIQPTWQGATQTDIVERKRHILSGLLTLTPIDKLVVSINGSKTTNEFPESVTGLLDQSFDSIGIDATYAANERLSVWAGYSYEKYFFDMEAAYIPRGASPPYDPANLWGNATTDKVDTLRAGLTWVLKPEKVDLDASIDYTKPRSDSLYDFTLPGTEIGGLNEANGIFPANVPPVPGFTAFTFDSFPVVTKKFIVAKVKLAYHVSKNLTASAMYWKQKYDNTDWQTDLTQPYMGRVDPGANRWFWLGARIPSYDADVFRASLTYSF